MNKCQEPLQLLDSVVFILPRGLAGSSSRPSGRVILLRLCLRQIRLVVLALPFLVGAVEVFDAALVEVPEAGGYFVDQVVVVGNQKDRSLVALEGDVEGVDGFEV